MQRLISILFIFLFCASLNYAQVKFHWKFDENQNIEKNYGERWGKFSTQESVNKTDFQIKGLTKYVPGVKGSAIKFDGFSSYIEGAIPERERGDEEDDVPAVPGKNITVEAWVAIGAYPWNWAPIVTAGKYKITGFYFGIDSRGRLGFHVSDATSVWHEANSKLHDDTRLGMELQKWHHVVGTYSAKKMELAVYIDGKLEGTYNNFTFDYGIAYSNLNQGFRMGKNREDLAPSEPIRDWATYPSRYTLDGIVDEVKIHGEVLSAEKIAEIYKSTTPENEPSFDSRKFPTVKPSGRFYF